MQIHTMVQEDLSVLQVWSDTWTRYVNASSCKALHIGKDNARLDYLMHERQAVSNIEKCNEENDMAVSFKSA